MIRTLAIYKKIFKKFSMKPTSSKCNSYTRDITVEGRISCLLESKKMVHCSTPKTRRRITTWKIQRKWFMIFCKESLALRMPKVDSNFSGFTEWEKEQNMPKELYQLRKAQMKKLQNAKHQGSTAYLSRKCPDKLFIDGNYIPRNWFNIDFLSFFQHACELIWNFFPFYAYANMFYYIDTSVLLENIPLVKFINATSGTRVVCFP